MNDKLQKLFNLTLSSNDHEALSALRRAQEYCKSHQINWNTLVSKVEVQDNFSLLSSWKNFHELTLNHLNNIENNYIQEFVAYYKKNKKVDNFLWEVVKSQVLKMQERGRLSKEDASNITEFFNKEYAKHKRK